MKTFPLHSEKHIFKNLVVLTTFVIAFLSFSTSHAQANEQDGRIINGIVSNENGPVDGATIVLKGTKSGTSTNSKGEFTFPKPLKTGDILLISYLGYKNQELKITDKTTSLEIVLTEDLIEFTGALNSNKPYKSKRSN